MICDGVYQTNLGFALLRSGDDGGDGDGYGHVDDGYYDGGDSRTKELLRLELRGHNRFRTEAGGRDNRSHTIDDFHCT